jgi:Spy/CpxP family protein refolding chaperone
MKLSVIAPVAVMMLAGANVLAASPYAGEQEREIKALSRQDLEAYLAGQGMGFAKAAELNGYAGPKHVLELASELSLTEEQRTRTEALFASMQSQARSLGREIVDQERNLDQLFASKAVTQQSLRASLDRIAGLQSRLRATHLQAHLEQAAILTSEQNALYARLRGYGHAAAHHAH